MNQEKLFIRDLINLCEQYGIVFLFQAIQSSIIHENTSNNLYNFVLEKMRELE